MQTRFHFATFFLILGVFAVIGFSQIQGEKDTPFYRSLSENSELLPDLQAYNFQKEQRLLDVGYLSNKRNSDFDTVLDQLLQKAEQEKKVRVIVGFQQDFKVEGGQADQFIAEQQAEIKYKQNDLVTKLAKNDVQNLKLFSSIPYVAMTVDADTLRELKNLPEVTSITEDKVSEPALNRSTAKIRAPGAWTGGYTGAGWTIAIIDSGVEKAHPFLTGKVVSEACYSTHDPDNEILSTCPGGVTQSTQPGSGEPCQLFNLGCDHGTHVAGIAAGTGTGKWDTLHGVARGANLIAINAMSSPPRGKVAGYDSDVIRGLERVMQLRSSFSIAAVNMSLGRGFYSQTCDNEVPAVTTAIANLRSVGIPSIVSAGNDSSRTTIGFPSCISSTISVGATDISSDTVAPFSNSNAHLDLLAPGSQITSSVPGGEMAYMEGTSMAAPHVAGAWALLKQRSPSSSIDTNLNRLISTGVPITDTRNNITKRRIDVGAATDCVSSVTPSVQNVGNPTWSGSVNVTATSGCTWTAVSNSQWLFVTGQASGAGSRAVSLSASANTSGDARTGSVTILGRTFWLTQSPGISACATDNNISIGTTISGSLSPSDCTMTNQPTRYLDSYRFNGSAGQRISILMQGGQVAPAIYLLNANGTVIGSNIGVPARFPSPHGYFTLPQSGQYRIYAASATAGQTGNYALTVNNATTCDFRFVTPDVEEYEIGGGSGTITVITEPGCFWIARRPTSGWITFPPSPSYGIVGYGTQSIPFDVAPSNQITTRVETISVDEMESIITQMAVPTAASVTVAGRVVDATGRGLSGVRVSIDGASGSSQSVSTSSFGYFQFEGIEAGRSYVINASHKRHTFAAQALTVMEQITDLQMIALD